MTVEMWVFKFNILPSGNFNCFIMWESVIWGDNFLSYEKDWGKINDIQSFHKFFREKAKNNENSKYFLKNLSKQKEFFWNFTDWYTI